MSRPGTPAGSPPLVLGLPSAGAGKEQGQSCWAAPLRSVLAQCPHVPKPGWPSEDPMLGGGVSGITDSAVSVKTLFIARTWTHLLK